MADLKKTIAIIFNGIDNTGKGFNSVSSGLQDVSGNVQDSTQFMADFSSSVLKTEAALLTMIAAFGGFSISKAIAMETALTALKKVADPEELKNMETYKDNILGISDRLGISAVFTTDAVTEFREGGFIMKEAVELTEEALKLATTGGLSVSEASETLSKTVAGFGIEVSEVSSFVDTLTTISNNYGANVTQLSDAFSIASATGKAAGLTYDDLAGFMTVVIETNKNGLKTGTAFASSLLRLSGNTKEANEAMMELGFTQKEVSDVTFTAGDRLKRIIGITSKLTDAERLNYAQKLFGIDQGKNLITLLGKENRLKEINANLTTKQGSANEELVIALNTTEKTLDRTKESFTNLSTAVGDKMLESTKSAGDGFTEFFKTIKNEVGSGTFDELFDSFNVGFASFTEGLDGITKALPEVLKNLKIDGDFEELAKSFGSVSDSLGDLFGFDKLGEADLENKIKTIIKSVISLNNITVGIIKEFDNFFEKAIKPLIENFNDLDTQTQNTIGKIAGIGTIVNKTAGAVNGMAGAVSGLATTLTAISSANFFLKLVDSKNASSLALQAGQLTKLSTAMKSFGIFTTAAASAYAGFQAGNSKVGAELINSLTFGYFEKGSIAAAEYAASLKNSVGAEERLATEKANNNILFQKTLELTGKEVTTRKEAIELLQEYNKKIKENSTIKSELSKEDEAILENEFKLHERWEKSTNAVKKYISQWVKLGLTNDEINKKLKEQASLTDNITGSISKNETLWESAAKKIGQSFQKISDSNISDTEKNKKFLKLFEKTFNEYTSDVDEAKKALTGFINKEKQQVLQAKGVFEAVEKHIGITEREIIANQKNFFGLEKLTKQRKLSKEEIKKQKQEIKELAEYLSALGVEDSGLEAAVKRQLELQKEINVSVKHNGTLWKKEINEVVYEMNKIKNKIKETGQTIETDNAILKLYADTFGLTTDNVNLAAEALEGLKNGERQYIVQAEKLQESIKKSSTFQDEYTESKQKSYKQSELIKTVEKTINDNILKGNEGLKKRVQDLANVGVSADLAFKTLQEMATRRFEAKIGLDKTKFEEAAKTVRTVLEELTKGISVDLDSQAKQWELLAKDSLSFGEESDLKKTIERSEKRVEDLQEKRIELIALEIEKNKLSLERLKDGNKITYTINGEGISQASREFMLYTLKEMKIEAENAGPDIEIGIDNI